MDLCIWGLQTSILASFSASLEWREGFSSIPMDLNTMFLLVATKFIFPAQTFLLHSTHKYSTDHISPLVYLTGILYLIWAKWKSWFSIPNLILPRHSHRHINTLYDTPHCYSSKNPHGHLFSLALPSPQIWNPPANLVNIISKSPPICSLLLSISTDTTIV